MISEMANSLVFFHVAMVKVFPHPAHITPVKIPLVSFILHLLPTFRAQHVQYCIIQRALEADLVPATYQVAILND